MQYGLLGKTLSHSHSPWIHSLFGNSQYSLFEVPEDAVDSFMRERPFSAINVTIPYKQTVLTYCDTLSPEAAKLGNVNTILNAKGHLCGFNTDYYGFMMLAKLHQFNFNNARVLVLGSGGSSLTVQAVLQDSGVDELHVVSRNGQWNYANVYEHADADFIINTTPVGMSPNVGGISLDLMRFNRLRGVIDLIYNPLRTNLLLQARELGIPAANGLSMLVFQAKLAHELFFSAAVSDADAISVLRKMQGFLQNIVLIGMPGCGKSTIGRVLAEKLGRQFIDTDAWIEERCAMSIPQIFAAHGETWFREVEKQAVLAASLEQGVVIATGGGVVLFEENRQALLRDGRVFFLDRDIQSLSREGRPLSQSDDALAVLRKEREPYYKQMADRIILVADDADKTAEKILSEVDSIYY